MTIRRNTTIFVYVWGQEGRDGQAGLATYILRCRITSFYVLIVIWFFLSVCGLIGYVQSLVIVNTNIWTPVLPLPGNREVKFLETVKNFEDLVTRDRTSV